MATLISELAHALSSSVAGDLRSRSRPGGEPLTPAEVRALAMLLAINSELIGSRNTSAGDCGGGGSWDELRVLAERDVQIVRSAVRSARESASGV